VSLVLLFAEKRNVFSDVHSSVLAGATLILIGVFQYWMIAGQTQGGSQALPGTTFSLVIICIGAFIACYGTSALRRGAFPLLFLLVMIPLPDSILSRTIFLLQQGSTEITYWLIKLSGVPVFRQGFQLMVPGVTIEVAAECSGIRSSMALFITCLMAAHLFLKASWRKLFFVILSLPFAVIKNGIRIATLTLLSIYVDPTFLTGRLHQEGGFVFFLIALSMLGSVLFILRKAEHREASARLSVPPSAKADFARG